MADIFVISGFLGSGKSEFVRELLIANRGKRVSIIENEIAEFGVDGKALPDAPYKLIEINDGSIGGVNLGLFRKALSICLDRFSSEVIIIEMSGAADIEPVLCEIKKFPESRCFPVAVIDLQRFSRAEKLSSSTISQIKNASLVILNKSDLVDNKEREKHTLNIRKLNSNSVCAVRCAIGKKAICAIKPKDISKVKSSNNRHSYFFWKVISNFGIARENGRHEDISAYVYSGYGKVDEKKLQDAFKKARLERAKGFIFTEGSMRFFSYSAGHFEERHYQQGKSMNRIVAIGKNAFFRRSMIEKAIKASITKSSSDFFSELFFWLLNQQKISQRMVISDSEGKL